MHHILFLVMDFVRVVHNSHNMEKLQVLAIGNSIFLCHKEKNLSRAWHHGLLATWSLDMAMWSLTSTKLCSHWWPRTIKLLEWANAKTFLNIWSHNELGTAFWLLATSMWFVTAFMCYLTTTMCYLITRSFASTKLLFHVIDFLDIPSGCASSPKMDVLSFLLTIDFPICAYIYMYNIPFHGP